MSVWRKRFIALLFIPLFFLGEGLVTVGLVRAASIRDLEAINDQIENTKEEIVKKQKEEKSVLNALTRTQKELERIEKDLAYLNAKLKTQEQKIRQLEAEINKIEKERQRLEREIQQRQEKLDLRLVAAYKYGPTNYLEPLISARSFADFISKFEALTYFLRNDLSLLGEVTKVKEEIAVKQRQYEEKRRSLEEQRDKYANLKRQTDRSQKQKSVVVASTTKELKAIQNNRKKLEAALDELEQTSKEIEEQIRRKQRGGEILGTGKMIWPVRGRISSNFGWRFHPILKKNRFHSGIDLAVVSGTNVAAADSGRVLVSGWNGGYGYFVAIDHGNGISTAYGHNSRLLVSEGDIVVKGQTIAKSGSTGLSTGPHLHFEVRKDGKPVNPIPFLP